MSEQRLYRYDTHIHTAEVSKCGKYFTDYREILTEINGV